MSSEYILTYKCQTILFLLDIFNNPWFKAKDVTKILEYANGRQAIRDHVKSDHKIAFVSLMKFLLKTDEDEDVVASTSTQKNPIEKKTFYKLVDNKEVGKEESKDIDERMGIIMKRNTNYKNFQPNTIFINECGVYNLILKSTLKNATIFKAWVSEKVLPTIRKFGNFGNFEMQSRQNTTTTIANNYIVDNTKQLIEISRNLLEIKTILDIKETQMVEFYNNVELNLKTQLELFHYKLEEFHYKTLTTILQKDNDQIQNLNEKIEKVQEDITPKTSNDDSYHNFILMKLNDQSNHVFCFHYYVIRCQKKTAHSNICRLRKQFPNCEKLLDFYDPNAFNLFLRMKERLGQYLIFKRNSFRISMSVVDYYNEEKLIDDIKYLHTVKL